MRNLDETGVSNTTMLLTTGARGLQRAIASSSSISIPSFLLPAFQMIPSRAFSATSDRESQVGKAPLTIPPEVNFTVIEPQIPKNGRHSAVSARPTVSIEGPLGSFSGIPFSSSVDSHIGKLTMTVPPFVHLEHDASARKAVVSVEDREIRKQREMWGTHLKPFYVFAS